MVFHDDNMIGIEHKRLPMNIFEIYLRAKRGKCTINYADSRQINDFVNLWFNLLTQCA